MDFEDETGDDCKSSTVVRFWSTLVRLLEQLSKVRKLPFAVRGAKTLTLEL